MQFNKCDLLIRIPSGNLVNLGKIQSMRLTRDRLSNLKIYYEFIINECENSGDFDGDEEITNDEWRNLLRSDV